MSKCDYTRSIQRNLLLGALALNAILAAAAGGAQAAPRSTVVSMSDMNYGSIPHDLKVGDTIVWVNHDTVSHTVTARDHSFDLRVNPGKSVPMVLDKAGVVQFYCIYHTAMRGTLIVAAK